MSLDLNKTCKIHFVGIGGAGMGGIAEVLLTLGHKISGSDVADGPMCKRLAKLGAAVNVGHAAKNVKKVDAVVVSSAITTDNPEVLAAAEKKIPILRRASMLALLMDSYHGIAIAGTHGKTTTTSLIASVLDSGDLDPTFVIGGLLKSAGTNAQLGSSKYFVAEADESDASFLCLNPEVIVITNIDADHLETYDNDYGKLEEAFLRFADRVPESGVKVVCVDDPGVMTILPRLTGKVITYGFSSGADLQAFDYEQDGLHAHYKVRDNRNDSVFEMVLHLPGKHNVLNSLAAIAVGLELDVSEKAIAKALKQFKGVGRRFQLLGDFKKGRKSFTLIDDYGHHPRELTATLSAMRKVWPKRRLLMVFQPHRFSRTQALWEDFVGVLSQPDKLVLLDIYPASEQPIDGVTGSKLAAAISKNSSLRPHFVAELNKLPEVLGDLIEHNDVVLLQGAGSVGKMALELAKMFK